MPGPVRLVAALGGLAVAFVIVMLVSALSPDPALETGEAEMVFDRFSFSPERLVVTADTDILLGNEGAVPVTLFVGSPDGTNRSVPLDPGGESAFRVTQTGTYKLWTSVYEWTYAEVEVRSANPFTRFFEDIF